MERSVIFDGDRDVRPGAKTVVSGRLRVITHRAALLFPGFTEIRVERAEKFLPE